MAEHAGRAIFFHGLTLLVHVGVRVNLNTAASSARVLTTALDTPVVAETTMCPNLLHALKRVAKLDIYVVRGSVDALASLVILLPVKEPHRDLKLKGVLHDGDYTLNLVCVELAGPLGGVNLGLLAQCSEPFA